MSKESLEYLFGTLINKKMDRDDFRTRAGDPLIRGFFSGQNIKRPYINVLLSQLLLCEIINFARDTSYVTHARCVSRTGFVTWVNRKFKTYEAKLSSGNLLENGNIK